MKLEPISKLSAVDCNSIKNTVGESYFEVSLPTTGSYSDSYKLSFKNLTSYIDNLIQQYISNISSTIDGKYLPITGGELKGSLQINEQLTVQGRSTFNNQLQCSNSTTINTSGVAVGNNINLNLNGSIIADKITSSNLKVTNIAELTARSALWS